MTPTLRRVIEVLRFLGTSDQRPTRAWVKSYATLTAEPTEAQEYRAMADALEQAPALQAELEAAREALGEAWLTDGASLAEGIQRKTAFLERLVDEAGPCEECDGAGVVEHVPGAGSSTCDPAAAEDVPCPGCRRAEHEAWERQMENEVEHG